MMKRPVSWDYNEHSLQRQESGAKPSNIWRLPEVKIRWAICSFVFAPICNQTPPRTHILPHDRQTSVANYCTCNCTVSGGFPKEVYLTYQDEKLSAQILWEDSDTRLKEVYMCSGSGLWHLTSKFQDHGDFQSQKSTPRSRLRSQPLTEYPTENDAICGVKFVLNKYGNKMEA